MVNSIKPQKQRKGLYSAPLNVKRDQISSTLSKDLRKEYKTRSVTLRKGDQVEVMRGSNKGKKGLVSNVDLDSMKVNVEGINVKKKDGTEVSVDFNASNLRVIQVYTGDKRRFNVKGV